MEIPIFLYQASVDISGVDAKTQIFKGFAPSFLVKQRSKYYSAWFKTKRTKIAELMKEAQYSRVITIKP